MANGQQIQDVEEPKLAVTNAEVQKSIVVDTVHGDEALKVIVAAGGDDVWEDLEEKKVVGKIDRRLMPILCMTYGVQYYDKAMLAQAVSAPLNLAVRVFDPRSLADRFPPGSFRLANGPRA
jgi:hypothetical protein